MKDINKLITELGIKSNVINFDSASLGYAPECVIESLNNYMLRRNLNGSEYSLYWEKVAKARELTANRLKAKSEEIFFIQSTSMGLNLAAKSLPLRPGDEVLVTDMEFPSNIYPWLNLESDGIKVNYVHNHDGVITFDDIVNAITPKTKAVSVSWVMSTNGLVIDCEKLGNYLHSKGIFFIVDGIQGFGAIPFDVKKCKCDFFVSGFFKWMMGPDGIAIVYINPDIMDKLSYPWLGWAGMKDKFNYSVFKVDPANEARRYETGNMNYSAIQALVPLLEMTNPYEEEIYARIKDLVSYLRTSLKATGKVQVHEPGDQLSGITFITADDNEKLISVLKSHSLHFTVRNGVRISIHFYNTKDEIDVLVNAVRDEM